MKVRLLHVLTLAAFALAQPLYDVLHRNGEFFVAHRVDRLDLLLLVLWLSFVIPALVLLLPTWIVGKLNRRAGTALVVLLVGLLVVIIVMPIIDRATDAGSDEVLIVSAAHGLAAALIYWRFAAAQTFLTVLSPAVIVFPLVFLLGPAMRPFVAPHDPTEGMTANVNGDTPIVILIFDQLPLTSLLDGDGNLDAHAFPGFAQLAQDAIWFRNSSSVADFTGWAVPPILSGVYPDRDKLPIVEHYPGNIYTALAGRYRMESVEPITALCPDTVCRNGREPRRIRQLSMLSDLTVVYARVVLPASLTTGLPRLTENWRDFVEGQNWHQRWNTARDLDRRVPPREFIEGISGSDPQPTLYMLHALLPHEPYVYMRGGRRFAEEISNTGYREDGRWSRDPLFSTQVYRRHLLQVQYVDWLVERTIARLKEQGLYDRALIVVTSDHGVSFRPNEPMKGLKGSTAADTVPVPLFIKPPHHTGAEISDRNVQAVDVMPTIAQLLHVTLPWKMDGVTALDPAVPAPDHKTVYYAGASRHRTLPASLHDMVLEGAARKAKLFGPLEDDYFEPEILPFPALLGKRVADVNVGERSQLTTQLGNRWQYASVNPESDFVPARFTGRLADTARGREVPLAIAINGVIRTTTRSLGVDSNTPVWTALARPDAFTAGANTIDIYEIAGTPRAPELRLMLHSGQRPQTLNLVMGEAHFTWDVAQEGFYPRERLDDQPFRWTNGDATVRLTLTPYEPPAKYLRVQLARIARPGSTLTISVNGCQVFTGAIPQGAWDRTFDFSACPADLFAKKDVRIRLASNTARARRENRILGVPVTNVELRAQPPDAAQPQTPSSPSGS
ncbi:MAG TPA: sulfatase-like hydrolase/transferase [Vicinamibacterales bacterium]|nr:sulfatase-like hydrolase/transferase [Vicinamibacterales bacterium]